MAYDVGGVPDGRRLRQISFEGRMELAAVQRFIGNGHQFRLEITLYLCLKDSLICSVARALRQFPRGLGNFVSHQAEESRQLSVSVDRNGK